jgi:starvation-inducible DNA-binding protein
MNELQEQLKIVLASTFSLYLKAHNFHWNVEGPNFVQYHGYFGEFYGEFDA